MTHLTKEIYNTLYIQPSLHTDLQSLDLTKPTHNKALHLIHLITKSSRERFNVDTCYVPMPKAYLVTVFGNRYFKIINALKDSKVIQCDNKFSKDTGKCLYYKVNRKYYKGDELPVPVTYKHKQVLVGDKAEMVQMYQNDFEEFFSTLTIDHQKLREITLEVIDSAKNVEEKREMVNYWQSSIDNLKPNHLRARRNSTNFRLDSNFTNMPTELREQIMIDNDLVNIDLSNSQFAILSMLLRKKELHQAEDVLRFYKLSEEGTLYEYIAEQFKEEGLTRKDAKKIMFETAFGYVNGKDQYGYKEKFAFLFPTVHAWIKQFKLNHGDAQFPVWLQRTEANIFIDGIKTLLMDEGIKHTTIHDSVMVHRSDVDAALEIVNTVFEEHQLRAKVTVDNMSADVNTDLLKVA